MEYRVCISKCKQREDREILDHAAKSVQGWHRSHRPDLHLYDTYSFWASTASEAVFEASQRQQQTGWKRSLFSWSYCRSWVWESGKRTHHKQARKTPESNKWIAQELNRMAWWLLSFWGSDMWAGLEWPEDENTKAKVFREEDHQGKSNPKETGVGGPGSGLCVTVSISQSQVLAFP